MKKENNQKGSVTIEATIGLTAFIFLIVAILSFINICRTQMVISLAVDATAKEMSQYAYFYGLTGLQDVADNLSEYSKEGKSTTNELVGYTKDMFSSLGNIKDKAAETKDAVKMENPPKDIDGAIEYVSTTAESLKSMAATTKAEGEKLKANLNAISKKFEDMDVEAYMRSMGALAANTAYHAVLSRLICPVLAKGLCKKHFEGYGDGDADEGLKNLGIKEGMKGLNFNMSEMFGEDDPTQIKLVCYYSMELSTLIDLPGDKRMVFKKEAITNAWLNGFSKKNVDEGKDAGAGDDGEKGGADGETPSEEEKDTPEEEPKEPERPEHLKTDIDDKVTDIEQQSLPLTTKKKFAKEEYRTVVTTEPIVLYRYYGGDADDDGSVFTTTMFSSEEEARQKMAELPEWNNSMTQMVSIIIPAGTTINIGTTASQTATDDTTYLGGGDLVILPDNWYDQAEKDADGWKISYAQTEEIVENFFY